MIKAPLHGLIISNTIINNDRHQSLTAIKVVTGQIKCKYILYVSSLSLVHNSQGEENQRHVFLIKHNRGEHIRSNAR